MNNYDLALKVDNWNKKGDIITIGSYKLELDKRLFWCLKSALIYAIDTKADPQRKVEWAVLWNTLEKMENHAFDDLMSVDGLSASFIRESITL